MIKNILKVASVAGLAVVLTGCEPTESEAKDFAQKAIASILLDPDSARFSGVTYYDRTPEESKKERLTGTVCGYVNGKNRFGGYTGDKAFYANVIIESRHHETNGYAIEPTDTTRTGLLKDAFMKKRAELCRYGN